jgi:hypothetical protein
MSKTRQCGVGNSLDGPETAAYSLFIRLCRRLPRSHTMHDASMTISQQLSQREAANSAFWMLDSREAFRLEIGPGPRALHLAEGRLWLTREGTVDTLAEDIWLTAGDTLALEDGSEWVIEAWGSTRFQLLVPPRACERTAHLLNASSGRPASGWLSSSRQPSLSAG